MREIDLSGIVDQSAEKFWDARIILGGGRKPWAETDPVTKQEVKNAGLPFIAYAVGPLFREFSRQVNQIIKMGVESGFDADTILLAIEAELAETVSP